VAEGHSIYEQSQVADQKVAADQAVEAGVEYVDTSAYEQYEKQEGDFVEGSEAFIEAAETTVPPDEEQR
jgi:saccharopine dehydrogenase-like NADP-dependent oxidoreductase